MRLIQRLFLIAAAVVGSLLREAVNYIEHYRLIREKTKNGFGGVMPVHSWNPIAGRNMLFELSTNYLANRKYQIWATYGGGSADAYRISGNDDIGCSSSLEVFWYEIEN